MYESLSVPKKSKFQLRVNNYYLFLELINLELVDLQSRMTLQQQ